MTDLDQRYATRSVPRYTSYPTAPHFHAGIDGSTYSRWLDEIPAEEALSLPLPEARSSLLCRRGAPAPISHSAYSSRW